MKLQTIVSAFEEEITNRALRAIVREYTEMDVPVCEDGKSPLGFYSELTGNPLLNDKDLDSYEMLGFGRRGVQVGNLLLVFASVYYDQENEPGTIFSVYLLPDGQLPPKPKKVVTEIGDLDLIARIVRESAWVEADPDDQYFGAPPKEGVEMCTEAQARLFLWSLNIDLSFETHPWGFSTQVIDLAPDPVDVAVIVFWDGDGTAVIRLRKDGCEDMTIINRDCKKDYGWEVV